MFPGDDLLPMARAHAVHAIDIAAPPPRALVLGDRSLSPDSPRPRAGAPRATWAFSLEPIGDGGTHLEVHVRAEYEPSFTANVLRRLVTVVHDVMERKQLRTIKRRVEGPSRRGLRGKIQALVGEGDRIALLTLPFAAIGLHPIYTAAALLVVPGLGLIFDSWLGVAIGVVLYLCSRRFAPNEERELAERFPREYAAYRRRVLLPWV